MGKLLDGSKGDPIAGGENDGGEERGAEQRGSEQLGDALQSDSLNMIKVGIFVAGFFAVAQLSFWGNYIPLVFPLHLRGTGESFAANIGGRILGTFAAFITLSFSAPPHGSPPNPAKIATVGAIVAGSYALIGAICTHWLPEPAVGEPANTD